MTTRSLRERVPHKPNHYLLFPSIDLGHNNWSSAVTSCRDSPSRSSFHHRDSSPPDTKGSFHHIGEVLCLPFEGSLSRKTLRSGQDGLQWEDLLPSNGQSSDRQLWAGKEPQVCVRSAFLWETTAHDSILAGSTCDDSEDRHPQSKTLWVGHSAAWTRRRHANGLLPRIESETYRACLPWSASIASPLRGEHVYSIDQPRL